MFSELAVFIAGVVVFIIGFGLAYRQGKKRGYEDGYSVGICNGYGQGYTTASENLIYLNNSSEYKDPVPTPENTIDTVNFDYQKKGTLS